MKRKMFISLLASIIILLVGLFCIKSFTTKEVVKIEEKYINVSLVGAVRFHDPISVKTGTTLGELLMKAELLYDADLNKVDKNKKIYKSSEIFIPFVEGKQQKHSIKEGVSESFLISKGIRRNTAKEIVKFIKKHKERVITWKDLDSLRGVGEVTLNLLKKILDLN